MEKIITFLKRLFTALVFAVCIVTLLGLLFALAAFASCKLFPTDPCLCCSISGAHYVDWHEVAFMMQPAAMLAVLCGGFMVFRRDRLERDRAQEEAKLTSATDILDALRAALTVPASGETRRHFTRALERDLWALQKALMMRTLAAGSAEAYHGVLELRQKLSALYEDISDDEKVRQRAEEAVVIVDRIHAAFTRLRKELC